MPDLRRLQVAQRPGTGARAARDVVLPHRVYGPLGWVSVVNPGDRTASTVLVLLRRAHERDRARAERPGSVGS
jgi:hypothetical protein